MLHLPNGVRLEGDEEIVFRQVDLEQASGDGLYAADLADSTGLPEARLREVLSTLVEREVLAPVELRVGDELGPRYVKGRAV